MTTLRQRYENAKSNYLDLREKMNRIKCDNIADHELGYINSCVCSRGISLLEEPYSLGFCLSKCLICDKYIIMDYFGRNEKEITLDFFKDYEFLVSDLKSKK